MSMLFMIRSRRARHESYRCTAVVLTACGESPASHRDGRGAPLARRDDREYREYLREEQRSQRGCIARRMQPDFHRGLLGEEREEGPRRRGPCPCVPGAFSRGGSSNYWFPPVDPANTLRPSASTTSFALAIFDPSLASEP